MVEVADGEAVWGGGHGDRVRGTKCAVAVPKVQTQCLGPRIAHHEI